MNKVYHTKQLEKQIRKGQIPMYILIKLQDWVEEIVERGLENVRKIPGYHDEPCVGQMKGFRSIRLGKGWRAYYYMNERTIMVQRVDKHEY
jgi:proteic killer suppression protein